MSDVVLATRSLVKRFEGVTALGGVDFELRAEEVHALCGENGAGKSTLIKLLAGVHAAGSYDGDILRDGSVVRFHSTRDAERAGISIVHQELALFREMTVAENIFLGDLPRRFGIVDWSTVQARTRELLGRWGIALDPGARVAELGVGQQQLLVIARALRRRPQILVLDEPTAALARHEIDVLLGIVRRLRAEGVACIYISHKLDEVFAIADRITVLRDGLAQGTLAARETNPVSIIAAMVGRRIDDLYPRRQVVPGRPLLSVEGLTAARRRGSTPFLRDITLTVRAGEVLGIGGLMGAGRTELLMHLIGAWGVSHAGSIELGSESYRPRSPRDAFRRGLALVSEDRKRYGLVLSRSVAFNLSLASLKRVVLGPFVDATRELGAAASSARDLRIKTPHFDAAVATLSGGNQQKVVIGKMLRTLPEVLLLDEPTRGIDVGAKVEVYELINRLTQEGKAIVLASSELGELLGISDRIVMLHEGRIGGVFERKGVTQERLLAAAMGRAGAEAA
jgi:D-xylose transport system ATP-binding protein